MCSDHSRKELWLIIFYYSPASERHFHDVNIFKKCRTAEKKKGFFFILKDFLPTVAKRTLFYLFSHGEYLYIIRSSH